LDLLRQPMKVRLTNRVFADFIIEGSLLRPFFVDAENAAGQNDKQKIGIKSDSICRNP
jgi:hypothetical protein